MTCGRIRTATAGMYASILLDMAGRVWTCGENSWDQLGQGVTERQLPRQPFPTLLRHLPPMRQADGASGVLAMISTTSQLWLAGWCSPVRSAAPVHHSDDAHYLAVTDTHLVVVHHDQTLWTGGYFPGDGKLARPCAETVISGLRQTLHSNVHAMEACAVGTNTACTAWATEGTWKIAGASFATLQKSRAAPNECWGLSNGASVRSGR